MTDFQVVIFDCDGVMFDTRGANTAYYNHMREHFGLPLMTESETDYIQMATVYDSVNHIMPDHLRAEAQEYRRTVNYRQFVEHLKPEPDLVSTLESLRLNYKTALCTNRTGSIHDMLKEFNLAELFDKVISCLDVVRPKPDPEGVEKILAHFRVTPTEAVFIGDSEADAQAARGAGVFLAAFRNPKLDADFHLTRLSEIKTIVNGTGTHV